MARYHSGVAERFSQYDEVAPRREVEFRDPSRFDRLAFAMRALRRLRLKGMTVAVYPAEGSLRVERGRDYQGGEGATWAIIGIPRHASREHIAYALAELVDTPAIGLTVQAILAGERWSPS